jgi:hypothetical protein
LETQWYIPWFAPEFLKKTSPLAVEQLAGTDGPAPTCRAVEVDGCARAAQAIESSKLEKSQT